VLNENVIGLVVMTPLEIKPDIKAGEKIDDKTQAASV